MADIPETVLGQAGSTPAPRTAAANDTIATPSNKTYLHVDNANASACTVTFTAEVPCNQGSLHDLVVSVPAGQKRIIGPIDGRFIDSVTGKCSVGYSVTASVQVYVLRG